MDYKGLIVLIYKICFGFLCWRVVTTRAVVELSKCSTTYTCVTCRSCFSFQDQITPLLYFILVMLFLQYTYCVSYHTINLKKKLSLSST